MIRKEKEQEIEVVHGLRGGEGDVVMRKLLAGEEEMYGKGRIFNVMTFAPGTSTGYHRHDGESETFYVLEGEGEFNDDGAWHPFTKGDVLFCGDGHSHAVRNNGAAPVQLLALILYK